MTDEWVPKGMNTTPAPFCRHLWRPVGMLRPAHYECARCHMSSATEPPTPRVWSRRSGAELAPPDAVYVGRPTSWGNPFNVASEHIGPYEEPLGVFFTRERAIEEYRAWMAADSQEPLRQQARRTLRGKHLVCWCAPLPCHADVLLEIANAEGP
jgi:hypothetical protein